ncbi:MAG: YqaJ viral recombinase family protein [Chloroflexi bacterium]|nr:YqaJ viral recombinase family protein [Chloroflexota bacterium]
MSEAYTVTQCKSEEEWLELRSTGIGASEAAAVLGESPWSGPLDVYVRKVGIADGFSPTEAMEWGHRLEPVVAEKYREETGRIVEDPGEWTVYKNTEQPYAMATLDRIVTYRPDISRGPGAFELKTAGAARADDWAEGPPRHYWIQVQHQLAVTGWSWGSIAVLIGGNKFLWQDIERDDEFIAHLKTKLADFWQRVQEHDPPPPDDTKRSAKLLQKIYPQDTGEIIDLAGEAIGWDEELWQVKAEILLLDARKIHYENILKAAIGSATKAVLPNGVFYTWPVSERAGYEVKACTVRTLRRHKPKS